MQQSLGRLANDSSGRYTPQNPESKVFQYNELGHLPCLCLLAKRNTEAGIEIRYDYGQNDLRWRKVW